MYFIVCFLFFLIALQIKVALSPLVIVGGAHKPPRWTQLSLSFGTSSIVKACDWPGIRFLLT